VDYMLARMADIVANMKAVSYTHLDVYKRQRKTHYNHHEQD